MSKYSVFYNDKLVGYANNINHLDAGNGMIEGMIEELFFHKNELLKIRLEFVKSAENNFIHHSFVNMDDDRVIQQVPFQIKSEDKQYQNVWLNNPVKVGAEQYSANFIAEKVNEF